MDRATAGVHYLTHVDEALDAILERCLLTYGPGEAEMVAKGFIDLLFGQNLLNYCDVSEVYSLWAKISRQPIRERVYLAEFVIGLHQQLSFMVGTDNAPGHNGVSVNPMKELSALGNHLVHTVGIQRPSTAPDGVGVHLEIGEYASFMQDIPTHSQVANIINTFPWMAGLYLLSISLPKNVMGTLDKYIASKPQGPGNE